MDKSTLESELGDAETDPWAACQKLFNEMQYIEAQFDTMRNQIASKQTNQQLWNLEQVKSLWDKKASFLTSWKHLFVKLTSHFVKHLSVCNNARFELIFVLKPWYYVFLS